MTLAANSVLVGVRSMRQKSVFMSQNQPYSKLSNAGNLTKFCSIDDETHPPDVYGIGDFG
jgi:hypothetical protein